MALILKSCQCRATCSGDTFVAWLETAQKAGQILKIETGTVPRRTIRRSLLAQQLLNLWWKEQQPKASVSWKRGEVQRFACGVPALPSTRPDSTVVVCAGRNWAALGSPFF
jgi:hypothetical protein